MTDTATLEPETETANAVNGAEVVLAALGLDGEDLSGLMEIVELNREKKRLREEKDRRVEQQRLTGYPKVLYNSKFPFESIALPGSSNRISFDKGRIEVPDHMTEQYVKDACPHRIFEADMSAEKVCTKCRNYVTASTRCWEIHLEWHTPL